MTTMERAIQLRQDPDVHYNCAQSVLIPYAEKAGMSLSQANAIAAQFGAGMRVGGTCGAVTGALMVLGLLEKDPKTVREFWNEFKAQTGAMDCAELLKLSKERGEDKKAHCDALVYKAVELLEKFV